MPLLGAKTDHAIAERIYRLSSIQLVAASAILLVPVLIFGAVRAVHYPQKPRDAVTRQASTAGGVVLRASEHASDGKRHLLLAATGSVAAIKLPQIARALARHRDKLSVRVLLTDAAAEFLQGQAAEQPRVEIALAGLVDGVYRDADEWAPAWTRGAPILHIELRRWADLMVVAPLSANALAALTHGLAGDLVGSVLRAWDTTGLIDGKMKKVVVAPAMNTAMWNHPVTAGQVAVLEQQWGEWMEVLRPVEKDLACGDVGSGAMREWTEIVAIIEEKLGLRD